MRRRTLLLTCGALAAGHASARAEAGPVHVLYAGSLLRVMEREIGPAFERTGQGRFAGEAGGSDKLANEIKAHLRPADVFISASPRVNDSLSGAASGRLVTWYAPFAAAPLVIGYSPASRFADRLRRRPWQEVLQTPGLRLGRTDPALDPKGRYTVELLDRAERAYRIPGLAQRVLGAPENPAQVLPEETLVGRLQSGEVDVGFFYSFETADLGIPSLALPPGLSPHATYTATVLRDAPEPAAAAAFLAFLFGRAGQELLRRHGLSLLEPGVVGEARDVPPALRGALGVR